MTAFQSKTFSVAEARSDVPDRERRANWSQAFGNSCAACDALGWAQTPMRNKKCIVPGCGAFFCDEHAREHMSRWHNLETK